MKGKAAGRIWLAAGALAGAAVLVLGPLAVGASRSDRGGNIDLAVVDMGDYPNVNDRALKRNLEESKAADVERLIIVLPEPQTGGVFGCQKRRSPETCQFLDQIKDQIDTVPPGGSPVAALRQYVDPADVRTFGNRVTTVRSDGGFGLRPALEVGLLMTIIVAGSIYLTALVAGRRWALPGPAPERPVSSNSPPLHAARSAPVQPAPARRPPPEPAPSEPPGPLPADVVRAVEVGRPVTAQTHFGPGGGFVDIGGVLLWASLERAGEQAYPGQRLSVLALSAGGDALVVSHRITEEVRS